MSVRERLTVRLIHALDRVNPGARKRVRKVSGGEGDSPEAAHGAMARQYV